MVGSETIPIMMLLLSDDTPVTPVLTPSEPVKEFHLQDEDERREAQKYRNVEIAGKSYRVDMHVIEPYKKVLSHGGKVSKVYMYVLFCLFLLLYVPCQQLWSLRDGQFT